MIGYGRSNQLVFGKWLVASILQHVTGYVLQIHIDPELFAIPANICRQTFISVFSSSKNEPENIEMYTIR
jgi:hypothetical protein